MYVEQAGFDSCHIQCFGYVTNMDSEHLSVVFDQKFYLNNQSMPGLSAINIDVETGTILKKEEQFNYSTRLAERFRKQCQKQNGLELSENEWPTEMLRKLLSSGDDDGDRACSSHAFKAVAVVALYDIGSVFRQHAGG